MPHCLFLNGKTVNYHSVTKTKYGRLEITWPATNHDLIDALEDTNFVNNVVRMEKKIHGSMLTTGYTNTKEEETHQAEKACVSSPKHNKTKTSRITHNNQNTLDCSQ